MNAHPSRTQRLINIAIVCCLASIVVALLLPETQWASTGQINATIQVIVTDVKTQTFVENASVEIIKTSWLSEDYDAKSVASTMQTPQTNQAQTHKTDENGQVLLTQTFSTGASHRNPLSRADTSRYSALVSHQSYGCVAIPLRYSPTPTEQLKQSPLRVVVGLSK